MGGHSRPAPPIFSKNRDATREVALEKRNAPAPEDEDEQIVLLRKVAGYLGLEWGARTPFETAKLIRGALLGDYSWDKQIAADDLRASGGTRRKRGRGRPPGSTSADVSALQAFALRESDPKRWSWPKLADELLHCKAHKAHQWDSSCTVKLKMRVWKLRAFLKELQPKQTP